MEDSDIATLPWIPAPSQLSDISMSVSSESTVSMVIVSTPPISLATSFMSKYTLSVESG